MSKAPTQAEQLRVEQVPIKLIQPSPTNPRKHFDQAALAELAESIKAVGVQVPLQLRVLVSERGGPVIAYEIVGGERRWRAAQIAGLTSVPAIARVMTDAECRESQLIENLQRADLTPMEEAESYDRLRGEQELPVEVLASKVGKTVPYVVQRLRLLALLPEVREALRLGVLNLTLALLIARLDVGMQEKAARYAVDPKHTMQGDLKRKVTEAKKRIDADHTSWWRCASETEMRNWIAEHTLLPLKGVAWRLDDPDLIPLAGPCTECPKRSGNTTALFGDLAGDDNTCTDPLCYGRKEKAARKEALKHSAGAVKLLAAESFQPLSVGATSLKRGQWVEAKDGTCPSVIQGVSEQGHRLTVCPDQKCKVHKHRVDQPMKRGESSGNWEERRKEDDAKRQAYVATEEPIRLAIWAAIKPKLKGAKLLRAVLHELAAFGSRAELVAKMRGIPHEEYEATEPVRKTIAKAKDLDLESWLADLAAADALSISSHMFDEPDADREELWTLGRLVGVDCDAIVKQTAVSKQAKAKPAAKPAKKAVAKRAPKPLAKKKAARK